MNDLGMHGRVLVVAGSDSGGGAGIQADIKTIMACGGYATTAVTALTAQNTQGVQAVHPVPAAFVAAQIASVMQDIGADVVKTGMLHDVGVIHAVADSLQAYDFVPRVVDPVMVATSGDALLAPDAVEALKTRLIDGAALVTPNLPEAEALTGLTIDSDTALRRAAEALLSMGAEAVLIKGGHGPGNELIDLLATAVAMEEFSHVKIPTNHTHGTGCTLASAIAALLGKGVALRPAVKAAQDYVQQAILHAPGLGQGHGPLQHAVRF